MTVFRKLSQFLAGICLSLSALLCLGLVALTVQQVIARYYFDNSSVAMQELQWHLFGALFLLACPACYVMNRNVRVDILHSKLRRRSKIIIELFGTVLFLLPCATLIALYGYEFAKGSYEYETVPPKITLAPKLCERIPQIDCPTAEQAERVFRLMVLRGETSPDPGGLAARWMIKATIPLSFTIVFLLGLLQIPILIGQFFSPFEVSGGIS